MKVRSYFARYGWIAAPGSETSAWRSHVDSGSRYNDQEEPFVKAGFGELESCAIDRSEPCEFLFQNASKDHLKVETEGEQAPPSYAKITSIAVACWPTVLPR